MYDVLVVGELNVDIILDRIQGFPEVGKEKLAENMTVTLGSSSAIFASNLSSLGSKVAFAGKIGSDRFGDVCLESLEQRGVHTSFIIQSKKHKTGATIVMNYGMDRANVTFPGAMDFLTADEISNDLLRQARHLHVSSIFMQPGLGPGLTNLFERAKSCGLTTSVDPQWDPKEQWNIDLESLLPYVDIFLPNHKEFRFLTNSKTMEQGIDKVRSFANTLVIKDGENGAHLWENGLLTDRKAYLNEQVADCIGAGDSFDAGFIFRYMQGLPPQACLDFGNLMGAINTTDRGGTAAFEDMHKIRSTAQEKFNTEIT